MDKRKTDKTKLNLIIDAIMLVIIAIIAGLGFLIKFVLIPGEKRNLIYGNDVDLFYMGMDRHQWGTIHLILSLLFILLLVIHIILHWKMIICIFKMIVTSKKYRLLIGISLGIITLLFALAPLCVAPDIESRENLNHTVIEKNTRLTPHEEESNHLDGVPGSSYELRNEMTLIEVAEEYDVPLEKLSSELGIPIDRSSETIGILKREFRFSLSILRESIINNQ